MPHHNSNNEHLAPESKIPILHGEPRGEELAEPNRETTWQEFHAVRNSVLRTCRRFGTVGDMGEAPITDDEEVPDDGWHVETACSGEFGDESSPAYHCVDDQWYTGQIFVRLEAFPSEINARLLGTLAAMLTDYPNWCVEIFAGCGMIWVWADSIKVTGPAFENCQHLTDFDDACRDAAKSLRRQERDKAARHEARLETIKTRTKEAHAFLRRGPDKAALVAGFTTTTEGKPGVTLWVMLADARDEFDLDEIETVPDRLRASLYRVTPDGQLHEDDVDSPVYDDPSAFLLAEWELCDGDCEPLPDVESVRFSHAGKDYEFELGGRLQ